MIPGRGSQGGCRGAAGLDENGDIGSSGSGGSSRAGGRRRAGRRGEERRGSTAVSHKEREKGGEVELLPNVWWQAVARKSGSLGKSSHKDQQQKARGERRNG